MMDLSLLMVQGLQYMSPKHEVLITYSDSSNVSAPQLGKMGKAREVGGNNTLKVGG